MTASPLALIQLVSEQTMQNLLPVLRLHPTRLIHLATPKTKARSAWVAEAARRAGCPTELETITLSAMPTMWETRQATLTAIESAAQRGEKCILNFTGGTKLMSIGAFVAALRHKAASFYVDTQDSVFVDGQSAESLGGYFDGDLSFTPLLRSITLDVVAAANGCGRVTAGLDWLPWLPLAQHLFYDTDDEDRTQKEIQHTPQPRRPADWLAVIDREFEVSSTVASLAIQSNGFVAGSSSCSIRLPSNARAELTELTRVDGGGIVPRFNDRLFAAVAPLQHALNFLSGAWWEVIIAEHLRKTGRFQDIRWSVQVGERGGPELEEDVIALDGVRVAYLSCKRSSQGGRLLPQLEQIKARAERLGGSFNQRFLCIRHTPQGRVRDNLQRRASELGIRLILPEDLTLADPFG